MSTEKNVKPSDELTSITGRLGGDPEKKVDAAKHLDYVKFSVATREKKGDEEFTKWVDVSVQGKLKEQALELKKGELVVVTGKMVEKEGTNKTFFNLYATELMKKEQGVWKGNLVASPELKTLEKGMKVLEFAIANNESSEKKFHEIRFYGDAAEKYNSENLQKADFISIVGYENSKVVQQEGKEEKVYKWVNGKDLKILSRAKDRAQEKEQELSK